VQEEAELIVTDTARVLTCVARNQYFPPRNSQGYHSNGKSVQPVSYTCVLPVGSATENRK